MLPPLWGREGVTLIAAAENYSNDGKKRVSTEQKNLKTCVFNV
jgi:hypothetical protein